MAYYGVGTPTQRQLDTLQEIGYTGEIPSNMYKAEMLIREIMSGLEPTQEQLSVVAPYGCFKKPETMLEAYDCIDSIYEFQKTEKEERALETMRRENDPITEGQENFLIELGHEGRFPKTKYEASLLISKLKDEEEEWMKSTWGQRNLEWEEEQTEKERLKQEKEQRRQASALLKEKKAALSEAKQSLACPNCEQKVKVSKVKIDIEYTCDKCFSISFFDYKSKKMIPGDEYDRMNAEK